MRSRRNPSALLALAALLGGLGALILWMSARLQPRSPDVVYTVTPVRATGLVRVRVDLRGLAPGRAFFLAPERSLPPATAAPAVPGFDEDGARPAGPGLWWGEADAHGRLSLTYEVSPRSAGGRHALLAGSCTFAVPLHSDPRSALFEPGARAASADRRVRGAARRIRVRFRLPAGWDAYTPWGEPAAEVEVPGGSFARLRESFLALGDYVPHSFAAAGAQVEVVARATDPVREERLVEAVRACLTAHAAAVGPNPHPRLLVIIDHPFRGDQAAGETALNAVSLGLTRDPNDFASPSQERVLSHELFHLWNGGAVDLGLPRQRWFAEGATEYFGLRGLVASRRLAPAAMADLLAASLDRLRGNPWADSTLASLGGAYETDPQAWSATYSKGTLAAWALDLRLSASGGLDSLVRALVRQGRQPDLEAALAAAGGGVAAGLLDSLSSRRFEPAVIAELAAHGLRLERRPAAEMTMGFRFFRPGTTEILDLDPRGPAARAGVCQGDRVAEVRGRPVSDLAGLSAALADAAEGPIELRLERGGLLIDREVRPVRAEVTRVVAEPRARLASRIPAPGELPARR